MEKCTIKLSGTNDGRNYGGKSLLWKKPYGEIERHKPKQKKAQNKQKREWHAKIAEPWGSQEGNIKIKIFDRRSAGLTFLALQMVSDHVVIVV